MNEEDDKLKNSQIEDEEKMGNEEFDPAFGEPLGEYPSQDDAELPSGQELNQAGTGQSLQQPTQQPQIDGVRSNAQMAENPAAVKSDPVQPNSIQPGKTDPKQIKPSDANKVTAPKEPFKPGGGEALKAKPIGAGTGASASGKAGGKVGTAMEAAKLLKNGLPKDKEGMENLQDEVAAKGIGFATKLAVAATGAGAAVAGVAGNLAEKAARKLKPLRMQRKIIMGAGIILLCNILILFATTAGIASSFSSGILGKSDAQPAAAYDDGDMSNINFIIGNQKSLLDYKSWYFNQGSDVKRGGGEWGNKTRHVSDGWGPTQTYGGAGCALTSGTMVVKYYGVENVNPLIFGKFNATYGDDTMGLKSDAIVAFLGKFNINKKMVEVPKNINAIRKEIDAGNPIIAQGRGAWGAGRQHWVVIVGVSDDGKFLILNDPTTAERGKAGRPSPASELSSGRVLQLWAFHNR